MLSPRGHGNTPAPLGTVPHGAGISEILMNLRLPGLLAVWLILAPSGFGMKVGTFNIRYDNRGDVRLGNQWQQRAPVIAAMIRFHDFDVLGTQEGFEHQMTDLRKLMPEYDCVSFGRDDGKLKGEHVGIFYRKDRFEVLESGMSWLSEHPEKPGKGWDADLPRICTWAKMRRIPDGKPFGFLAVHLDHRGNNSRLESMKLLQSKATALAENGTCYLVGDFNTDQNSEPYRHLIQQEKLGDAADRAEIKYIPTGTANRFDPNSRTESRIDHVFVTAGVRVLRYGVLTDTYRITKDEAKDAGSGNFPKEVRFRDSEARLPSDHFPVLVETADP